MRKILCSVLLGMTAFAFTVNASTLPPDPASKQYAGSGTWKKSKGGSGEYTAKSIVEKIDTTVNITDEITSAGKTHTIKLTLRLVDNTFYDAFNEKNEQIGTGYCFKNKVKDICVCHTDLNYEDGYGESTIEIRSDRVYRMGSKVTAATGERIIWTDELKVVGP